MICSSRLTQLPTAWSMVSGRFGVHLFEGRADRWTR
jgi:hypothetical protein